MDKSYPNECPKCNGQVVSDYGRPYCLQCGNTLLDAGERKEWFKKNVKNMATVLIEGGNQAVIDEFHINRQMISHIKSSKVYKRLAVSKPAAAPAKNGLPPFPEFRDTWDPDVQRAWLEAYPVLVSRK